MSSFLRNTPRTAPRIDEHLRVAERGSSGFHVTNVSELSWNDWVRRNGSNTPEYWQIVARRGELPVNPMTFEKFSMSGSATLRDHTFGENPVDGHWYEDKRMVLPFAAMDASPGFLSDEISDWELAQKVRETLQDDRTWRAPLFAAELGKTVEFLHDSFTRVYRGYVAAKKGNFAGVYKAFDMARGHPGRASGLASAWMSYRYGVMPLLYDIRDAYNAARHLVGAKWPTVDKPTRTRVRLKRVSSVPVAHLAMVSPNLVLHGSSVEHRSRSVIIRWGIDNPKLYVAASMGLTNPAALAWELTKFSWMVDWALPIGDFLTHLDAFHGISVRQGSVGRKESYHFMCEGATSSANEWNGVPDARGNVIYHRVQRGDSLNMSAMPSWSSVSLNLNAKRVTDVLALLRGAIRR